MRARVRCKHACMSARVHVRVVRWACAHMRACQHAFAHACMSACACARLWVCARGACVCSQHSCANTSATPNLQPARELAPPQPCKPTSWMVCTPPAPSLPSKKMTLPPTTAHTWQGPSCAPHMMMLAPSILHWALVGCGGLLCCIPRPSGISSTNQLAQLVPLLDLKVAILLLHLSVPAAGDYAGKGLAAHCFTLVLPGCVREAMSQGLALQLLHDAKPLCFGRGRRLLPLHARLPWGHLHRAAFGGRGAAMSKGVRAAPMREGMAQIWPGVLGVLSSRIRTLRCADSNSSRMSCSFWAPARMGSEGGCGW